MSRKAHFFVLYYDSMLTFESIVTNPEQATSVIELKDKTKVLFRPLLASDVEPLATFLGELSQLTRERSSFDSYDLKCAHSLCDAINKYDKLRFVCATGDSIENTRIVGLIELSFGIPSADIERFSDNEVTLNEDTDLRFGPTLSDDYQGKGLGTEAFKKVIEITKGFGKQRILLWGGVLASNNPAVSYYKKLGFKIIGEYKKAELDHLDMLLTL